MNSLKRNLLFFLIINLGGANGLLAQDELITNIASRKTFSLNGKWQYIVDPYETGYYDYRWMERNENNREAYWNSDIPKDKTERIEHGYSDKYTLNVPGDWNSQDPKFLYYEGTVWYKKSFDYKKTKSRSLVFLHFGAVNYKADVYLNGRKLGSHKGGFTAFNFEVPIDVLKEKDNYLIVKVDNKRAKDEIPTLNTDWWNYGGITRDVNIIEVPENFIRNYIIYLDKAPKTKPSKKTTNKLSGYVELNKSKRGEKISIEIPELKISKTITLTGNKTSFSFPLSTLQRWSPENPRLYKVIFKTSLDKVEEKIGFRTIVADGKNVLLNGESIFLRGICIHEEIAQEIRRAYSKQDALQLLSMAKELGANMVRLAHYPHNENMTRLADSLGILVWSEIPVYWTIDFTNNEVLQKAKLQLKEMIDRDQNRSSIIIWSVGNETPVSPPRTEFMRSLIETARIQDSTRLISAALEVHYSKDKNIIDDPLGQYTDIVSVNEYLGWYGGLPSSCRTAVWETKYEKPLFFSETGAEALSGFHADSLTRWSEEYQEWYYKEQVAMMKRMPDNYVGLAPWILTDFRSPKRNNPVYQEGWNNKGLINHSGGKKKAFYILKAYYEEMKKTK